MATRADLDPILQLDRATHLLPHWTLAEYAESLASTGTCLRRCIFVAETPSEMVGFAVGKVTTSPDEVFSELETVAVTSSARRTGIGMALCSAVLAWCREQGAGRIELEVRSRSEGPIALYRRLGFRAIGHRPSYYRDPTDDAILMTLDMDGEIAPDSPDDSL